MCTKRCYEMSDKRVLHRRSPERGFCSNYQRATEQPEEPTLVAEAMNSGGAATTYLQSRGWLLSAPV